jgi:hypothetical protein
MKLKIISDGTCRGTKVVNSETGEMLEGVKDINWKISAGSFSSTIITLGKTKTELKESRFRLIRR